MERYLGAPGGRPFFRLVSLGITFLFDSRWTCINVLVHNGNLITIEHNHNRFCPIRQNDRIMIASFVIHLQLTTFGQPLILRIISLNQQRIGRTDVHRHQTRIGFANGILTSLTLTSSQEDAIFGISKLIKLRTTSSMIEDHHIVIVISNEASVSADIQVFFGNGLDTF